MIPFLIDHLNRYALLLANQIGNGTPTCLLTILPYAICCQIIFASIILNLNCCSYWCGR